MNKNNITKYIAIAVIILCAGILVYTFVLKPSSQATSYNAQDLAPVINGKQVIAMTVYPVSYEPRSFTVKAGVPVHWEITSSGQPGCASGLIIANGLTDPIYLNPQQGQVKVVEFTPQKPGTYKFSCSMNMARGTIKVVN